MTVQNLDLTCDSRYGVQWLNLSVQHIWDALGYPRNPSKAGRHDTGSTGSLLEK